MDTLVVDPFYSVMPAFFGMTFQELLAAKHPTAWLDFELGKLQEDAFLRTFFSDGRRVDRQALRAAVRDAYRWVDGMQPVVQALHAAGHELHVFSNYPEWHTLIEEKCGLGRYLRWTAVSCQPHMRARKPDSEAYAAAARAAGVQHGNDATLVLIDDRKQNVESALACGWAGIHFTNAAALVAELRARGIRGI